MPATQIARLMRGNLIENIHMGNVCIVDECGNLAAYAGDPARMCYYRSSSKPIQALPVILRGLNTKYGLTAPEIAIMGGSVSGEARHVAIFESIVKKTGLKEDDMIVKPCYPDSQIQRDRMVATGQPPRKFCHNCTGKHLALMLIQRDCGGNVKNYWQVGSFAHDNVLNIISYMADYPAAEIEIGIDGCGVPVYAVPLHNIAFSGMRMACPGVIPDASVRNAMTYMAKSYGEYPWVARGEGFICTLINSDPDIIGKGGAMGVYSLGIRSKRIGLSIKIEDGYDPLWSLIIQTAFRQISLGEHTLVASLAESFPPNVLSASGAYAGQYEPMFTLNAP